MVKLERKVRRFTAGDAHQLSVSKPVSEARLREGDATSQYLRHTAVTATAHVPKTRFYAYRKAENSQLLGSYRR